MLMNKASVFLCCTSEKAQYALVWSWDRELVPLFKKQPIPKTQESSASSSKCWSGLPDAVCVVVGRLLPGIPCLKNDQLNAIISIYRQIAW